MTYNTEQLVRQIASHGIELGIVGCKLAFRPSEKATPEIRKLLGVHKAELLNYLRRQSEPEPTDATFSNPLDLKDVLTFPVRLLGDLPLPPVLVVEISGFDSTVVLDFRKRPDTWRSGWRRKPKARPTFELPEIEALAEAAGNGCVRPQDFVLWCQRKQHEPHWRLDRATALRGDNELIRKPPESKNWTMRRLLDALGAKLRLIKIVALNAKTAGHGPYAAATHRTDKRDDSGVRRTPERPQHREPLVLGGGMT